MEEAIIALGGFIVGAVATGAVDFLRERYRGRKETQAVLRVLREDLHRAQFITFTSLRREQWWPRPGWELPTAVWLEHRHVLGRELDPDDWMPIAQAFFALDDLNRYVAAEEARGLLAPIKNQLHHVEDCHVALSTAAAVVSRLTGLPVLEARFDLDVGCAECAETGELEGEPCTSCGGAGTVTRSLTVAEFRALAGALPARDWSVTRAYRTGEEARPD